MIPKRIFLTLGQTVITNGVNELMSNNPDYGNWVQDCIRRYTSCDWGDLGPGEKAQNEEALSKKGNDRERVIAKYNNHEGNIYIITQWDRSYTTILFTDEY